jgi:hypothetical protein
VLVAQVAVIRRHITAPEVATAARAPTFVGSAIPHHVAVALAVREEAADLRQRRCLHDKVPLGARDLIDGMILALPISLSRDLQTLCVPSMGLRRKTRPAFHRVKPTALTFSCASNLHCNKALLLQKDQVRQIRLEGPVIGRSEIRQQPRDLRRAVNLSCHIFRLPRRSATKKWWRGFPRRPL